MMKSVKCSECGFVGWADAERCKKCGVIRLPDPSGNSDQERAPYEHYQPYQGYGQGELKTGLAMASLVLGILNLCLTGILFVPSIVGIVMAAKARKRTKLEPEVYGGEGLATAGLVTNIISAALILPMMIIVAIAVPNLLAARRAANEGASVAVMRKIHAAEATYQATTGKGSFGTFDELAAAQLVNRELAATGSRYGYKFKLEIGASYASMSEDSQSPGFHLVAVPEDYGSSGVRSFYLDETGVIRAEDTHGTEATALAPPLNDSGYGSTSRSSRGDGSRVEY